MVLNFPTSGQFLIPCFLRRLGYFFRRTDKNKGIFKSLVCFRRIPNNYKFKFENKLAYFGRLENGERTFQSQEPGRIPGIILQFTTVIL